MPLVKVPKFNLADKVHGEYLRNNIKKEYKNIPFKGTIIHIFEKFKVPEKRKVLSYYGIKNLSLNTKDKDFLNPKYGNLFGPMFEDRIIIKKENKKEYIVLPMSEYDRYFTLVKNDK